MAFALSRRSLILGAASVSAFGSAASCFNGIGPEAGAVFAELEANTGARIGVAGLNNGTGAALAHRAEERFPFCSTFKVIAVSAVLKRAETERGFLDRKVQFSQNDLVSYSPISSQHVGTGMTVAELCEAALQVSDNTAANLLIRLANGPEGVTAFARSIGDEAFRLDRWETALNSAIAGDERDTSTPEAMMMDLQRLILGNGLDASGKARLIEWVRGSKTGAKRIRAAAPPGWGVGDKTGTGDYGTANDIAVLWPPDKPPHCPCDL